MSITSANATFALTIAGVFPTSQALQQFSADDVFTTDGQAITQAVMGVDGIMTAGYTPVPIIQQISLMADSISNAVFEQWVAQMIAATDVFYANGVVILSSLREKWTLTKGTLTNYKPMPDAAKVLQQRRYTITWESVVPNPTDL